jgi:hypothetical protein
MVTVYTGNCLVAMVFDKLDSDKSCMETYNFLRSHAIRHDQQKKGKNGRQIQTITQTSNAAKKDKVKKVLALTDEIQ